MCDEPVTGQSDAYVAIDGDDAGRRLEALVALGDEWEVAEFSQAIAAQVELIRESIVKAGGRIVFAAGDSLLAAVPSSEIGGIQEAVSRLASPVSFSCGTGPGMREAMLALKLAKGDGQTPIGVVVWHRRPREVAAAVAP